MDCSPPGSSVHGILQARIPEWVALPSSRDLPDPGIEPTSIISLEPGSTALYADTLPSEPQESPPVLQAGSFTTSAPGKPSTYCMYIFINMGFAGGSESACNARGPGLMPGSGKFPGEGNGNPLWYSCLENVCVYLHG